MITATLTGPDVSEHQGDVAWDRVASEHQLALIRVADGDYLDRFYNEALRSGGECSRPG